MLVSDDNKALLRGLLDGALGELLQQAEEEAKSMMASVISKNLDDAAELAAAKKMQGNVQGYMLCLDRLKEIING